MLHYGGYHKPNPHVFFPKTLLPSQSFTCRAEVPPGQPSTSNGTPFNGSTRKRSATRKRSHGAKRHKSDRKPKGGKKEDKRKSK